MLCAHWQALHAARRLYFLAIGRLESAVKTRNLLERLWLQALQAGENAKEAERRAKEAKEEVKEAERRVKEATEEVKQAEEKCKQAERRVKGAAGCCLRFAALRHVRRLAVVSCSVYAFGPQF